jgi:hypothetical protein
MVNSVELPDEIKSVKSKYRVIFHVNNPDLRTKIGELSVIFDYWNLLEENRDDIVLDKKLDSAMVGSAYTQSSPKLTMRQLFRMWQNGRAIHDSFFDKDGNIVNERVYMVGMGGSVLSGAFVFWGIVPSRKLIIISDRSPEPYPCKVPPHINLYVRAARENNA